MPFHHYRAITISQAVKSLRGRSELFYFAEFFNWASKPKFGFRPKGVWLIWVLHIQLQLKWSGGLASTSVLTAWSAESW